MKKRLLMTASTFPRWAGDTEPRFILDLAKALNKYYNVTVLAPAAIGAKDKEKIEGVEVIRYHYLPIRKWETLCYPGAIIPRIKEKKIRILAVPFLILSLEWNLFKLKKAYDIVHAHWMIPQGIAQSFIGGKYIITGHGTDVTSMNKHIFKYLKKRCLDKAEHITVVSEKLKEILESVYNIEANKIDIISMGCNTSNFSPLFKDEKYFKNNGKKNIIFVGRLAEIKGVEYLIDAMEYVDANLYIVGKGLLETKLKKRAEKFGKKITFVGGKNHEELKTIYASADVFVAPSITTEKGEQEGFGLVIIEAMSSGVPVVASKSGGIVDIIRDGENGLLVQEKNSKDIADKINMLLSDETLRLKIVENALLSVKQYDYSEIANRYVQIIEKCF